MLQKYFTNCFFLLHIDTSCIIVQNALLYMPIIYVCVCVCVCVCKYIYVQFSLSVMSNSLRPHEPQHARPPCPSPTPGVHPSPCPSSRWCHPTISSSVDLFSSCPQSFPASGSFQMSQLFHQVTKVLEFQLKLQSLHRTPRTDLL